MARFAATTIGCKVNQYETQAVCALLRGSGLAEAAPGQPADLVVVNTCCVTAAAEGKSRRALRRAVASHPSADVLVIGCSVAQHARGLRAAAEQAGGAGTVHTAGHDDDVAAAARRCALSLGMRFRPGAADSTARAHPAGPASDEGSMREGPSQRPADGVPIFTSTSPSILSPGRGQVKHNVGTETLPPIETFTGHQRAFVKVQDGCDAFCSYCIVPHLRRRVWSRPVEEVLAEVSSLVAAGHKEVVLCGVCLGAYGRATAVRRNWTGPSPLPGLLRRVAAARGLWRVRLSSLDAPDVTDELVAAMAESPAVAPHLHLPLQSGSAAVLRRMNRGYAPEEFLAAVDRFAAAFPAPAVTTDVLVGFPGEGEEDFAATLLLARRAGFSRIHIFPFSPRRGTPAWRCRGDAPPPEVVKARCNRLAALARELAASFRRRFIGLPVQVLVERPNSRTPAGFARGLTDRYVEVTFPADEDLAGQVVPVEVTAATRTGVTGRRLRG